MSPAKQEREQHLRVVPERESEDESASTLLELGDPLIGVEELAAFLAVPATWVYERTSARAIPHFRVGRYIRFRASDVESWLSDQRAA